MQTASENLPYIAHTNRELGLMLRGIKPLAHFMTIMGDEPECLVRYWRLFDRQVSRGRLTKREYVEPAPALPHREVRNLYYALPGEEWRIDGMRALLAEPGEWTRDRERRQGELFGYENWQNEVWLSRWKRPAPL